MPDLIEDNSTPAITNSEPESLRDTLMASMEASEAGTLAKVDDAPAIDTTAPADGKARDEQGRFAPKVAETPAPEQTQPQPAEPVPAPSLTTWRKEYLPIQQKLAAGLPLDAAEARKLADYNIQREREYSTGISTYKAEAQNAKSLTDAIQEFIPQLQQANINPAQWITNLGNAHRTLALGTPEQKLQMFGRLAQEYGIPLPAVAQAAAGQIDPTVAALMAEINHMKQSVGSLTNNYQKQQENVLMQELAKFQDSSKYPHFERAVPTMIQLLESGLANDPEAAYAKAVRMDEGIWADEQARQAATQTANTQASKAAIAARARQASGQVKTGTSAAMTSAPTPSNDLRGSLESAFDQHAGGARV